MKKIIFPLFLISGFYSVGSAFTLVGSDPDLKGWNTETLKFEVNTASCAGYDIDGALEDAIEVWNSVSTSALEVKKSGQTTSTVVSDPPVVFCDSAFGTGLSAGADPDVVPGGGVPEFQNGRLSGGALILNINSGAGANIDRYSRKQLAIILGHEIGHILGLGHSAQKKALMYYDASAKKSLRLSQDDMDGITYLYPRDELAGQLPFGCGVVSNGSIGISGGFFLILVFLPVVFWQRLRNKTVIMRNT